MQPNAVAVVAWLLVALASNLLALIEVLGLLGVWHFHTISYLAHQHWPLALAVFLFFAALPVWWLWHVRQPIAT